MTHTREKDRHRSPIPISFSSSPSPLPASWNKMNSSPHPQGAVKLPQRASSARPREIASHGRMQLWIEDSPPSSNAGADVGHGLELNSVSVGAQPVASIADFAHNTSRHLAPPSVNAGGQLVPQVPGSIYNIGPQQAPLHALMPRPMPNNAEPVAGDDRRLSMNPPKLDRRPGVRGNPYKSKRADRRLPVQTLPFTIKHSILCAMQNIMEAALFFWAKQWIPLLLQKEGWDTPEAGELNHWLRTMNKYSIPPNAFSHSAGMNKTTLGQLLTGRLHYIRHAAVHRDPTITVSALKEMLADAHFLTQGLRDAPRTNKLQALQLALERDDRKRIEETIAAPISTFDDGFDPDKFRTQPRPAGNGFQQKENIQFSGRVNYANELGNYSGMLQSVEGQETMAHGRGRSVQRGLRDSNGRPQGLKRKRSETTKFEGANQQAGVIKHPDEHIDLTLDSDDGDPPATNPKPAKIARVIDLTGDESIALFRSPRASKTTDANM